MTRPVTFLVNPAAGGGLRPAAVQEVVAAFEALGGDAEVVTSPGADALPDLVAAAAASGRVVASVGGDGMLSHLVGPAAASGARLAVVPAGRGNDFARMLGLPGAPADVARVLATGTTRAVDLVAWQPPGASAERLVAGSVYAGIDARAAVLVHRMRRTPGPLQYPLGALRAIATYAPGRFRLDIDGEVHELDAGMVVVANSGFYGKGMHIAPDAALEDGVLDVVIVAAASRPRLVRSFPSIYDGSHVRRPEVTVLRGRRIRVAADPAPGRGALDVGADGEPLGVLPALDAEPALVEVRPAALEVLVPDLSRG